VGIVLNLNDGISRATEGLERIQAVLDGRKRILVASHNNPDPDSIASAIMLQEVVKKAVGIGATLAYSGVIGRAENMALLEYARSEFQPLSAVKRNAFQGVALVDAQPGGGNHPFTESDDIRLVFDHHRLHRETRLVPFHDIQPAVGATTTLVYFYWCATGMRLTTRFATLMLYALRSETMDMGREASKVDREVYKELFAVADLRALSSIVNAKVSRGYFVAVHEAIERTRLYGPIVITRLDRLPYPDVVAQIADYFLKYNGASYAFSIGTYNKQVFLSLRAEDPEAHMGEIARLIVGELGSAGGHGSAAGGQIPVRGCKPSEIKKIQENVIKRLLSALGLQDRRPVRLIKS
jgi:nanoRNase/pAp phosphatase (c-di-AMP/oligoRNAs hydrolase)